MKVSRGKASQSSDITVNEDLDFLSTYQVKGLASPASGEALRKGSKDIANAEIKDAAAIALSKIVNTYLLPTIMTTRGDMVRRGATNPERVAKDTAGKVWIMGADDPDWGDVPTFLTVCHTEVYDGAAPNNTWADLDLSATVGANHALVFLKIAFDSNGKSVAVRTNGDGDNPYEVLDGMGKGCSLTDMTDAIYYTLLAFTDSAGVIEWKAEQNQECTVDVIAYIK